MTSDLINATVVVEATAEFQLQPPVASGANIFLPKLWNLTKREWEHIPVMTLSYRLPVASLSITSPTASHNGDKTCDILRIASKTSQQVRSVQSRGR
jgi:hypothetical protein